MKNHGLTKMKAGFSLEKDASLTEKDDGLVQLNLTKC